MMSIQSILKKLILAGVLLQSTIALGRCKIQVIKENGATYNYTATKGQYNIPDTPCTLEANDDTDKRSPNKRRFIDCSYGAFPFRVSTPVIWSVKGYDRTVRTLHIYYGGKYDRVIADCTGY